jgi:Tol biopolymer transport system component
MAHDGSLRTSITSGPSDNHPAWSPDGTKIAFSRATTASSSFDIFVANGDGSGVTNVTNNPGTNYDPAWSPDGSRIAFSKNYDLWTMKVDGSAATMILGTLDSYEYWPSWSPDGSKIAFYGFRPGESPEIFTVNVDGTQLTNLTNHPQDDATPAWSPDGTRIAFSSARSGSHQIHVMNAYGSNLVQITRNGGDSPTWSPDGETIAFMRGGSRGDIYSIGVDGTNETRLTNTSTAGSGLSWQPSSAVSQPTESPSQGLTGAAAPTTPILTIWAVSQEAAVLPPVVQVTNRAKRATCPCGSFDCFCVSRPSA